MNGPLLKEANAKVADNIKFIIEQDPAPVTAKQIPMPLPLKKQLDEHKLHLKFKAFTP